MATLRREWVSVERAQQWIGSYDHKWVSDQMVDAMRQEDRAGKKRRWWRAIIVEAHTGDCLATGQKTTLTSPHR